MEAQDYFDKGMSSTKAKEWDEAIRCFTEAISLEPEMVEAWVYRGIAHEHKGEDSEAFSDYTFAISLDPENDLPRMRRDLLFPDDPELDLNVDDRSNDRVIGDTSKEKMEAWGTNGKLVLHHDRVCITRKEGCYSLFVFGLLNPGDKVIFLSSITSIKFHQGGGFDDPGFIQFGLREAQKTRGIAAGLYHNFLTGALSFIPLSDHKQDENTVLFDKSSQPRFLYLKEAIEQRIQDQKSPTPAPTPAPTSVPTPVLSDADEIEKLARLRDSGILTEEEFQQKKRQILGL